MESLLFAVLFISHLVCVLDAKPSYKIVKMPAGCEFSNYCYEKGDDYPQAEIESIVKELHIKAGDATHTQTENRLGEDEENPEDQPCVATQPTIDPIYYIRDTNDDVRYVVQNKDFNQLIREVKCREPGRMKTPRTPFDMYDVCIHNVTCVEELVPVKFLVLTYDSENVEIATLKDGLPMACSCKYTYPEVGDSDTCLKELDQYFEQQ